MAERIDPTRAPLTPGKATEDAPEPDGGWRLPATEDQPGPDDAIRVGRG